MHRTVSILIAFLGVTTCTSQSSTHEDDLLGDLRIYADAIRTLHTEPFPLGNASLFDSTMKAFEDKIGGLGHEQFLVELFKLNALINDEHTMAWPVFRYKWPLQVRSFDDGNFVIATDSARAGILHYELLAVNGYPMAEIRRLALPMFKQDNPSFLEASLERFMLEPEILLGLGILDEHGATSFLLASPEADTTEVIIAPIQRAEEVRWRYAPPYKEILAYQGSGNYWSHHDQANRTVYFNYDRCRQEPGRPFRSFNKELFQLIHRERPERIVVDLRSNGGGDSSILNPFLRRIRRSYLNNEGRLHVLIGRDTFSSAVMNAVTLKRRTKARIIGKMTGGNINMYGEVKSLTLPHTGILVTYSTKYWENWKGMTGGLEPDIAVPDLHADFIELLDRPYKIAIAE